LTMLRDFDCSLVNFDGISVEIRSHGVGDPLVFLHSGDGLAGIDRFLERFYDSRKIIVPSHPGFGRSDLPRSFTSVDDIAFFYLGLFEHMGLESIVLVGSSFGGWIAAQVAIIDCSRIAKLVLIDPLGIKNGDRESRDIVDMHAVSEDELAKLVFKNAELHRTNFKDLDDAELLAIARNRESFAYYGWRPYMHDPKLKGRLGRIKIPTLVIWGRDDGIVAPGYGREYSGSIKSSRFEIIDDAGHLPHVERPDAVSAKVDEFLRGAAA
jgi:pimeloyl-ACP methyl ester carboxylesterase